MRSVNTSLVVLLPILSLLLFGGDTLKDFAFAMFVGVAIGAYSSIFLAAPLLAVLKMREKRYQQLEARRTARRRGSGQVANRPRRATTAPPRPVPRRSPAQRPARRHVPSASAARPAIAAPTTEGASEKPPAKRTEVANGHRTDQGPDPRRARLPASRASSSRTSRPSSRIPIAFSTITDLIVVRFGRGNVDKVVGIEARGFIIASPVAYHFGAGFVPIRKHGQAARRPRSARTTSSSTARRRSSCTSTASTRASAC